MKKQCMHIWCLDHEIYFDPTQNLMFPKKSIFIHRKAKWERVFHAKCAACKMKRIFTKTEWLEHVRRYGYD